MAGRGYLKSRLIELKATELQEPPKQLNNITEIPVSVSNGIHHQTNGGIHHQTNGDIHHLTNGGIHHQTNGGIHHQTNGGIHHQTNGVTKTTVPALSNGTLPQALRGRRAYINRIKQNSNVGVDITSGLSSLNIENSKDNASQQYTFSPECISKLSVSTIQLQSQSMMDQNKQPVSNKTPKIEKAPVICRVLGKSNTDNYKMTQLSSNYIKIEFENNRSLYVYNVEFNPQIDSKSARFYLLNQHKELIPVKTFDGMVLYVPTMLPNNVTILMAKLKDESEVKITIKFKYENTLNALFYNNLLRSIANSLGLIQFNKSCFDPNKKMFLPEYNLEIWPGYKTAIDEFENGLYMCCDISHRILRNETVLQVMSKISDISRKNNGDFMKLMLSQLCGSTVITRYNNKTYKVDDIDFDMTPLSTFKQNNREITFVEYYKQMYDIKILDLKQPLLISLNKKKNINKNKSEDSNICCLIPELCNMTGFTEDMKNDIQLMKAFHTKTLLGPEARQAILINFVKCINDNEKTSKKLKDWGLKFQSIPVELEGPVYKQEYILMGNKCKTQVGINMDWGSEVTKNAMFKTGNLSQWAILYCSRDNSTAHSFCKQLSMCGKPLGMIIDQPINVKVEGTNIEAFVNALYNTIQCNNTLQLIVLIFPNIREDRYNAIKRICCAEIGIPSQVIISRTISRPEKLRSITQKIALQINCKIGGACWAIDIPLNNTMIIGIDVYHDKFKLFTSIVGFVASMDKTFTEWYSIAEMQKNTNQEIFETIHISMHKALNKFNEKNKILPERIIIYRDGVGDGDLNNVEELELKALQKYFKSYSENYCPKVTYIIVQKRINTRIFQLLDEKYKNPRPGTVIDNTITRRNYFDFFLVSQHVRQGTVNPTHYIVLQNDCNLKTENVQRLTYKLCHMYYNWCGTIKVPAPVQYAHKLAYLIGQNVKKSPKEQLCNTLFFL